MSINKQSFQKFLSLLTLGITLLSAYPVQAHIQAPAGKFGILGGFSTSANQGAGLGLQAMYGINDVFELGSFWGTTPGNLSFYHVWDSKGAFINAKFFESDSVALKGGVTWFLSQGHQSINPLGGDSDLSEQDFSGTILQLGAYFKPNPGITPFVIQSFTNAEGSSTGSTQLGVIFSVHRSMDVILSTEKDFQENGDAQLFALKAGYYFF